MQKFASWSGVVLVVVACGVACGSVKPGGLPDAGHSADAASDAPAAPVNVTVLSTAGDGAPDLAAKVLFQDADGSVISDGPVDAMGHAQAVLPRGGSVSAIRTVTDTPTALATAITTTTGVAPGDDLTFGIKPPGTIKGQGGQTSMTVNFTPPDAGASYTFFTACGGESPPAGIPLSPMTLHFFDSCHGMTFDLLVIASGGKLASPMFVKLTGVAYANGESFTILPGFTTMASFTVNLANIPDAVSNLSVTRSSMIDSTAVADQTFPVGDPPAGAMAVTVPFPQGFGTRSQVAISMSRMDATGSQQHEVHSPALSPSVDVDLGAHQLPWITSLALTTTGASWTTVAAGDSPDGMITSWGGQWNDGTRTITVGWRIVQPAEASGMTLPRLPATYAAIDPGQQTVTVKPVVLVLSMVDYDTVAGYAEFRQMPETLTGSIATLGAFVGMPFQRRMLSATTRSGVLAGAGLPASGPGRFAGDPSQ